MLEATRSLPHTPTSTPTIALASPHPQPPTSQPPIPITPTEAHTSFLRRLLLDTLIYTYAIPGPTLESLQSRTRTTKWHVNTYRNSCLLDRAEQVLAHSLVRTIRLALKNYCARENGGDIGDDVVRHLSEAVIQPCRVLQINPALVLDRLSDVPSHDFDPGLRRLTRLAWFVHREPVDRAALEHRLVMDGVLLGGIADGEMAKVVGRCVRVFGAKWLGGRWQEGWGGGEIEVRVREGAEGVVGVVEGWMEGNAGEGRGEGKGEDMDGEDVVQEDVVEEDVVEETVVPETAIQEAVVQEAVVQEAVVQEAVVQEAVVQEAVVQEAVAQETVVSKAVVHEAVVQETVLQEAVVQDTIVQETGVPIDSGLHTGSESERDVWADDEQSDESELERDFEEGNETNSDIIEDPILQDLEGNDTKPKQDESSSTDDQTDAETDPTPDTSLQLSPPRDGGDEREQPSSPTDDQEEEEALLVWGSIGLEPYDDEKSEQPLPDSSLPRQDKKEESETQHASPSAEEEGGSGSSGFGEFQSSVNLDSQPTTDSLSPPSLCHTSLQLSPSLSPIEPSLSPVMPADNLQSLKNRVDGLLKRGKEGRRMDRIERAGRRFASIDAVALRDISNVDDSPRELAEPSLAAATEPVVLNDTPIGSSEPPHASNDTIARQDTLTVDDSTSERAEADKTISPTSVAIQDPPSELNKPITPQNTSNDTVALQHAPNVDGTVQSAEPVSPAATVTMPEPAHFRAERHTQMLASHDAQLEKATNGKRATQPRSMDGFVSRLKSKFPAMAQAKIDETSAWLSSMRNMEAMNKEAKAPPPKPEEKYHWEVLLERFEAEAREIEERAARSGVSTAEDTKKLEELRGFTATLRNGPPAAEVRSAARLESDVRLAERLAQHKWREEKRKSQNEELECDAIYYGTSVKDLDEAKWRAEWHARIASAINSEVEGDGQRLLPPVITTDGVRGILKPEVLPAGHRGKSVRFHIDEEQPLEEDVPVEKPPPAAVP